VTWDQAKAFAKAVSEAVCADAPDHFTTTLAKKARGGKIFLDYLRNDRMATAVAPWSPRARPGAGIAFPLSWGQVKARLDPSTFSLHTAEALLKKPDPWKDFRKAEAPLRPALKAMGGEGLARLALRHGFGREFLRRGLLRGHHLGRCLPTGRRRTLQAIS
jgi:bifunctional non-homologous end joining protein LigD